MPDLAGYGSHEEGHRNFQHPGRKGYFGPQLDNFSAWVVFISLILVSLEPRLWRLLGGGDERLLFSREDFERPEDSRALQIIAATGRPECRLLADRLRSLLACTLEQVPDIEGAVIPAGPMRAPAALPDWLKPNAMGPTVQKPPEIIVGASTSTTGAEWIFEHLISADQRDYAVPLPEFGKMLFERLALVMTLFACSAAILGIYIGAATVLQALTATAVATLLCASYFAGSYRRRTKQPRAERAKLRAELRQTESDVQRAEACIGATRRESLRLERPLAELRDRLRRLRNQHESDRLRLEQEEAAVEALKRAELRQIDEDETRGLQQLIRNAQKKEQEIRGQLAGLDKDEQEALAKALKQLRDQGTQRYLLGCRIEATQFRTGIGGKVKMRLLASGVITAADVSASRVRRVEGIGWVRAQELENWRRRCEQDAERAIPNSLPLAERSRILAATADRRNSLEKHLQGVGREENQARSQLMRVLGDRRESVRLDIAGVQKEYQQRQRMLLAKQNQDRSQLEIQERAFAGQDVDARRDAQATIGALTSQLWQQRLTTCRLQKALIAYTHNDFRRFLLHVCALRR